MSSIDQQFVEFVVKSLVSKPDEVQIERSIDEKGVLLELTVDPEDLGRVIGKRGATAQSIRTLLRALGTKNDARYNLKIVDNGVAGATHAPHDDSTHDDTNDDAAETRAQTQPERLETTDVVSPVAVEEEDLPEEEHIPEVTSSDRITQTRKELAELDDLDL